MSLLRIVTGYRSEAFREEVPAILYVGFNADAAKKQADSAPAEFHRVELLETRGGKRLRKSALPADYVTPPPAPAGPVSEEDARELLARIEQLDALLRQERRAAAETLASALAEIEHLKSPSPSASSEIPAADEPVTGAAAEIPAESVVDDGPVLEAPRAPARPRRN